MDRPATSRANPWIQALWLLALLGIIAGGAALFIGYRSVAETAAAPEGLAVVLIPAGAAVLGASLVAIALGFAVSAPPVGATQRRLSCLGTPPAVALRTGTA